MTPNIIRIRAQVDAPDRLVVEQNFPPVWWAARTATGQLKGSRRERREEALEFRALRARHHMPGTACQLPPTTTPPA